MPHFRRPVLESLHGWDAWNVTEDADLGIRLALAGYRVFDLPSATLEEAPGSFHAWLKQRQRWMKGFMQVVVTHSRRPLAALRALGPLRFFAAVATSLGTVATALGYPLFMIVSIVVFYDGSWLTASTPLEALRSAVGVTLFGAGLVAMIAPAVVAIERRRWRRLYPLVPLLPFYYALISIAAWGALAELIRDPFGWNKTEHGLARTSRSGLLVGSRAAGARRAAVEHQGKLRLQSASFALEVADRHQHPHQLPASRGSAELRHIGFDRGGEILQIIALTISRIVQEVGLKHPSDTRSTNVSQIISRPCGASAEKPPACQWSERSRYGSDCPNLTYSCEACHAAVTSGADGAPRLARRKASAAPAWRTAPRCGGLPDLQVEHADARLPVLDEIGAEAVRHRD